MKSSNMQEVAIGVRMHSGWGALVAVSSSAGSVEVIERRRISVTAPATRGANQPYHHAATLKLPEAKKFIAKSFANSKRQATSAIRELLADLCARQYQVAGAAILQSASRPLPPLQKILGAHPLLHAAEGQFFREAFAKGCETLGLAVTKIRERDLEAQARQTFGKTTKRVQLQISKQGRKIGPPWTTDQKSAALAASVLLANESRRRKQ
jgi:hypothetical protein